MGALSPPCGVRLQACTSSGRHRGRHSCADGRARGPEAAGDRGRAAVATAAARDRRAGGRREKTRLRLARACARWPAAAHVASSWPVFARGAYAVPHHVPRGRAFSTGGDGRHRGRPTVPKGSRVTTRTRWNPLLQRARIEAAFAASGASIPAEGLTLVGYSSGASIAEPRCNTALAEALLASRAHRAAQRSRRRAFAKRARRRRDVVLARRALSCLKAAVQHRLTAAVSVATTYVEMPKCTHGQVADGERAFNEAFDWLDLHG